MRWTSSFIFLLTNRIRIDHDVSNQSYKYKAKATNFSTNWNKEILKSLLYNFRSLPFTLWSRGWVIWRGKKIHLNKMVGALWAMWEWWIKQRQSPNLHWAKESYVYNAYFVHIGVFVWISCLTIICRFPRKKMTDGWRSEVEWGDRHAWNRPLRKIP